jgi:hypothetical protein
MADDDRENNQQFIAQCVLALSMPIASVGYLVIFLIMQPVAYRICVSWFTCGSYDDIRTFGGLFMRKNNSWSSTRLFAEEDMNFGENNHETSLLRIADGHQILQEQNKKFFSSDQLSNFDGKIYCYSDEGEHHNEDEITHSYNNHSVLSWFSYSLRSDNSPRPESVDHANVTSSTIQGRQT